ncbi:MAG: hypothetical protein AAF467_10745 [Actinomycetota bacterium]
MTDHEEPTAGVEPAISASPLPFEDLDAPLPAAAEPPPSARWLAFGSILVGGLLGALIGYGTGDLMGGTSLWAAIGALIGAAICAVGVGIVANLTLRAMNEWQAVRHPEAEVFRRASKDEKAATPKFGHGSR